MEGEGKVIVGTYARTPVVLVKGKGCNLYDLEGKEYLDLGSGIAVNALGHGDEDWIKADLLTHVSNVYYNVSQVKLAKWLVATSLADRVFFTDSGTEENEAAIKFSRKLQRHSNPNAEEYATEFVAFSNSFHGRTMGALALTSKEHDRTPFQPVMPGVTFVEDEVQCGLGRTGTLWAHEAFGVYPDIMTLAKPLAGGLPIGPLNMVIMEALFSGSPLVCHAALAVAEPQFLSSVADKGQYFKQLLTIKLPSNPHVKEIRGVGLTVGIKLDVSVSPLVDACREAGLLILTAGEGNAVRPLTITEEELERAVDIIVEAIPALDRVVRN